MEMRNGATGLSNLASGSGAIRPAGLVPTNTTAELAGADEALMSSPPANGPSLDADTGRTAPATQAEPAGGPAPLPDLSAGANPAAVGTELGTPADANGNTGDSGWVAPPAQSHGAAAGPTGTAVPPSGSMAPAESLAGPQVATANPAIGEELATRPSALGSNGAPAATSDGAGPTFSGLFLGVVVDVDLSIYAPINIAIATDGGTALAYQLNAPSFYESAGPSLSALQGIGSLFPGGAAGLLGLQTSAVQGSAINHASQMNFNISDHDASALSAANSGGNTLEGLLALNVGNPAISTAVGVNVAPVSQSNEALGSGGGDFGFGQLRQGNVNISDHDASALSGANSGGNTVIGGLLAINAANPAISTAVGLNFAPVLQSNALYDSADLFDPDYVDLV